MTRLDTMARRHVQVVKEEAARGVIPLFQAEKQRQTRRRTWSVLVPAGAALALVVVIIAGVVSPDDQIGSGPSNGLIVKSFEGVPAVVTVDGTLSTELRFPTGDFGEFVAVTWAPDGRRMAIKGSIGPLIIFDAISGETSREITGFTCPCSLDWSPDGATIAISTALNQIRLVDVATGEVGSPLPIGGSANGPSWSPDSQWIAFSYSDGADLGVAKVRPDGSDFTVLQSGIFGSFQWSPDSHLIAGLVSTPVNDSEVEIALSLVMLADDGSGFETVAELGVCACLGAVAGFDWSPDGRLIALNVPGPDVVEVTGSTSEWGFFLIEPDGTGLEKVSAFGDGDPAWQPRPRE